MSKVILVTGNAGPYRSRSHSCVIGTGSNTGIGFELVRLLAQKGHKVYLCARNETAGTEAA